MGEIDAPPQKKDSVYVSDLEESIALQRKYDCLSIAEKEEVILKAIIENGFPAPKREPLDPNYRPKKWEEITDEELWRMCSCSLGGTVDIEPVRNELPKLRKYFMQIDESEGFDGDQMPHIGLPADCIFRARCNRELWPDEYEEYMTLAKFAIEDYNQKNKTEFVVSKVENVNMQLGYARTYFMTFTAYDVSKDGADSASKTFQAKVYARMCEIQGLRILEFCRLKAEK